MRVMDALKFKRDLVHVTTVHRKVYAQMMISSFKGITSGKADLTELEYESLDNVVNRLGFAQLPDADVFYVGNGVMREYMNRALGPEPKKFGTVYPYTGSGIVVFEQPVVMDPTRIMRFKEQDSMSEAEWDLGAASFVPITAMSWCVGSVPTASRDWRGNEIIVQRPGCVVMLWSSTRDVKKVYEDLTGNEIGEPAHPVYPLTYASAAFGGWFIAESGLRHPDEDPNGSIYYNGDEPETAAEATAVVLVHELWAMLEEEIFVGTKQRASSKYVKMMRRLNMRDKDVSVITLRHVNYVGDREGDLRFIEWSHRWEVRGHYRRIRDRVTGQEKLVWVRPYIKGPDGKPLRETEKVNALRR